MTKILIVQTSFIGDTVLATGIFPLLRARFPDAELWFLGTALGVELLKYDPLLAGCIVFDKRKCDSGIFGLFRMAGNLRRHKFDAVYAIHRRVRTSLLLFLARIPQRIGYRQAELSFLYTKLVDRDVALHEVQRVAALLSEVGPIANFAPRLTLSSGALEAASPHLGDVQHRYALLAPGSVWQTKRWAVAGYRDVAQYLIGHGWQVIVSGAPDEVEVCGQVAFGLPVKNIAGQVTLSEAVALIAGAGLVVCNDSAVLHMACAFQRPVVAVFCATSPKFGFGPSSANALVVEKGGLTCKPCSRHGTNSCPTGTWSCMNDLSSSEVIDACKRVVQH